MAKEFTLEDLIEYAETIKNPPPNAFTRRAYREAKKLTRQVANTHVDDFLSEGIIKRVGKFNDPVTNRQAEHYVFVGKE